MSRNLAVDVLKVALAFFVVGLHGSFFSDIQPTVGYLLKNGLFRCAVPLFLIISGYYFYRINTVKKQLRFIGRILLLYSIWFAVYLPIFYKTFDPNFIIHSYFQGMMHLWYLVQAVYALFFLCLLRQIPFKYQFFLVGLCALAGLFLQYNRAYQLIPDRALDDMGLYRNGLFFCLPFLYIGYLIRHLGIGRPPAFWIFIATGLLFLESYLNYCFHKGPFDILLSLYLFCPAIFLFAISRKEKVQVLSLSQISTAIYLAHPYFLKEIPLVGIPHDSYTALTLAAFGSSLLLSFLLILINKRVKYIL